ncbi:uncharacterized protein N7483_009831 [Penicillium malachiteum]|uniref:uncharacterized protein n=1 Tax=Penicillium malachiteum TaxID=1324776 RepID=UPI002547BBA9|nr:uncharacterized protein N7483_009831 [Penicillium malachiteum]KAJ5721897.1 hypothetical protein N7483_009831 [Penicillium malachiteum]
MLLHGGFFGQIFSLIKKQVDCLCCQHLMSSDLRETASLAVIGILWYNENSFTEKAAAKAQSISTWRAKD